MGGTGRRTGRRRCHVHRLGDDREETYAAAADSLAEISLELGGKNAIVIHDTADLGACLDQVMAAACMCAGQRCTAISRVIVRRELHEAVVAGLVARFRAAVLGDGSDPRTTMGPLINGQQLDRVATMVEAGLQAGAHARGGRVAQVAGLATEPTVLVDVRPDMAVAHDEVFGPVIVVLPYDTLDEAFAILNSVSTG